MKRMKRLSAAIVLPLLAVLAACAPTAQDTAGMTSVTLSGTNEVPAVTTSATGMASATVSGSMVMITGEFSGLSSPLMEVAGTPGHIHQAPAGANGDVVFPLAVTSSDGMSGTFSLSTELTAEQLTAYNAGEFYINFHTEMNPGGELRGQIVPGMMGM